MKTVGNPNWAMLTGILGPPPEVAEMKEIGHRSQPLKPSASLSGWGWGEGMGNLLGMIL